MTQIEFDPKNKKIYISDEFEIEVIYSHWKRWMLTSDNMKYLPAFEVKGDSIDLINDWEIVQNNT